MPAFAVSDRKILAKNSDTFKLYRVPTCIKQIILQEV